MEVTVQTQVDGVDTVITHYRGKVGDNLSMADMQTLAQEFWPFVLTDGEEQNFEKFVTTHYIENGTAFYAVDLNEHGENVHTQVKFVY